MHRITNIWATDEAYALLKAERARFRPRREGEVFALIYWSSYTEPDGTAVADFVPGYSRHSESPHGLSDHWAMAQLIDGPDFLFMPRFKWRSDEDYVVAVASEKFATFSIGPAER
jgi:hypothetical protein